MTESALRKAKAKNVLMDQIDIQSQESGAKTHRTTNLYTTPTPMKVQKQDVNVPNPVKDSKQYKAI